MKRINRANLAYILASSMATLAVVAIIWLMFFRGSSLIPPNIQAQLQFTPFILTANNETRVDPGSYSYDTKNDVLRFSIVGDQVGKLAISEQPTPPQFIDIQDYSSKFVDSLNRYSAFDNEYGTVYLTQPKTLPNGQLALLNANGVLLLAQSSKSLTDDQWRRAFLQIKLEQ